jgi:histidine triad (HIT) family protein
MSDCIFCNIANREIQSDIVFEDDKVIAFRDLNPQAPIHLLIITKQHFDNILSIDSSHSALLGHLYLTAANIARQKGIAEDGFRLVLNCNTLGGQSVAHIHVHLLGGRQMAWPPG